MLSRNSEARCRKRHAKATELYEKGELDRAEVLYGEVVSDATELWGPDSPLTLLARGEQANCARDQPARQVELLEAVVADCERAHAGENWTIAPRLDLAAAYGGAGRLSDCLTLSTSLAEEIPGAFGQDDERASMARDLAASAADDLAFAELMTLIELDASPLEPIVSDWREHLAACATKMREVSSGRSRLVLTLETAEARDEIEWQARFVRPDRFRVFQTARSAGEVLYDEWLAAGDQRFINFGFWVEAPAATHESQKPAERFAMPDDYADLLERGRPTPVGMIRKEETDYLLVSYQAIPAHNFATTPPELITDKRTTVWIDDSTKELRRAQGKFHAVTSEGDEANFRFYHAFTSLGENISIVPPAEFQHLDPS